MRSKLGILFSALILVSFFSVVYAMEVPLPDKLPMTVKVGLLVNNIVTFDQANEAIKFVGTLTEQWEDKRLAHNEVFGGRKVKSYPGLAARRILSKIWHPELVIMKPKGPMLNEAQHVVITSTGQVTYMRRFLATTELHLNLSNFPFDKQSLVFGIMPLHFDTKQVQLQELPDRQGITPFARLSEWTEIGHFFGIDTIRSPINRLLVSHYYLKIVLARVSSFYVFQVMLPMVLIVLFSFSVFWMLHNPLVNRVAISLTAILTIVVFQWRVFNQIPRVNYHIFLDIFMLFSFMVSGFTLLASIILEHAQKRQAVWALSCRIVFPLGYFLGLGVIVLHYFA